MLDDYEKPSAIRKSDALHARVLAFATACDEAIAGLAEDSFESLAIDVARFQASHSPGFERMVGLQRGKLERLEDIPPIPADVFRLTRVALHPPELDAATFLTSGTSGAATGRHSVRTLRTKEELALIQARRTLFAESGRGVVVALAPQPPVPPTSSLTHMMQLFMEHFDGRPVTPDPTGARFDAASPDRWLMDNQGPKLDDLRRAVKIARHRSEPLYLLATSFAMLATLEALDGELLKTPSKTHIMLTGGFKGRSTEIDEDELRNRVAETFNTPSHRTIGEYGMTELGSQLFEHPEKLHTSFEGPGWWKAHSERRVYFAPPWLRVTPVDPITYAPIPEGEAGLAHFLDLSNIDSCLSVVTQDLVRQLDGGIELLGRSARAPSRGCSLPFESFVRASSRETG